MPKNTEEVKLLSTKLLNAKTKTIAGIVAITRYCISLQKGCFIKLNNFFLYIMHTAKSVARCSVIFIKFMLVFILKIFSIINKCPLLDTGKNSVSPCIRPNKIAI